MAQLRAIICASDYVALRVLIGSLVPAAFKICTIRSLRKARSQFIIPETESGAATMSHCVGRLRFEEKHEIGARYVRPGNGLPETTASTATKRSLAAFAFTT